MWLVVSLYTWTIFYNLIFSFLFLCVPFAVVAIMIQPKGCTEVSLINTSGRVFSLNTEISILIVSSSSCFSSSLLSLDLSHSPLNFLSAVLLCPLFLTFILKQSLHFSLSVSLCLGFLCFSASPFLSHFLFSRVDNVLFVYHRAQ